MRSSRLNPAVFRVFGNAARTCYRMTQRNEECGDCPDLTTVEGIPADVAIVTIDKQRASGGVVDAYIEGMDSTQLD